MAEFIVRMDVREYLDTLERALNGEGKHCAKTRAVGAHAKATLARQLAGEENNIIEVALPSDVQLSVVQKPVKRGG